jgi:hypothetical protein
MIADAQNPHPGVMPGYDEPYPVEAEALGRAYRQSAEALALGAATAVAPEVAAGARGLVTAGRWVAATEFTYNLSGGYSAGYAGQPYSPTVLTVPARLGGGLGWGFGFMRRVGVDRVVNFVGGLLD